MDLTKRGGTSCYGLVRPPFCTDREATGLSAAAGRNQRTEQETEQAPLRAGGSCSLEEGLALAPPTALSPTRRRTN
jgi:hypothetical protein